YVCVEVWKRKNGGKTYNGEFDDMMILYAAQHKIIRERYVRGEQDGDGDGDEEKTPVTANAHIDSSVSNPLKGRVSRDVKWKNRRHPPRSWQPRFVANGVEGKADKENGKH